MWWRSQAYMFRPTTSHSCFYTVHCIRCLGLTTKCFSLFSIDNITTPPPSILVQFLKHFFVDHFEPNSGPKPLTGSIARSLTIEQAAQRNDVGLLLLVDNGCRNDNSCFHNCFNYICQ